jgi:hypothetical protein
MPIYRYIASCQTTCCPTIDVDTDKQTVTIADDFGGTVTMSVPQMQMLTKFFYKTLEAMIEKAV